MANITTRETAGFGATVKSSPLTNAEVDNNFIALNTDVDGRVLKSGTSALIPFGTTGTRPGTPATGMLRYNTTTAKFEGHNGTAWFEIGAGSSVDLGDATGLLSVPLGGTGAVSFTSGSYIKGNSTDALQAQTGIPAADITGTLAIGRIPSLPASIITTEEFDVDRIPSLPATKIASGQVSVLFGGTGAGSFTSGGYIKGNGTGTLIAQVGIPASDIASGILPVARGGTGVDTIAPGAYLRGNGTGAITSVDLIPSSDVTGVFPATQINYTEAAVAISKVGGADIDTQEAVTAALGRGRNLIMNGEFQVAQRGRHWPYTSTWETDGAITVPAPSGSGVQPENGIFKTIDRWTVSASITPLTVEQGVFAGPLTGTSPNRIRASLGEIIDAGKTGTYRNPQNTMKINISTAANAAAVSLGGNNFYGVNITQATYNSRLLGGKSAVLTFWAKSNLTYVPLAGDVGGGGDNRIGVALYYKYRNGNTVGTHIERVPVTITLTGGDTWTKYTVPFTIPSTSGKSWDENELNYSALSLIFTLSCTATYANNLIAPGGGTNDIGWKTGTFEITRVQLEEGTIATPYEIEEFHETLQKCKPYFQKSMAYGVDPRGTDGFNDRDCLIQYVGNDMGTASRSSVTFQLPNTLRSTSPTVTIYSKSGLAANVTMLSGTGTETTETAATVGGSAGANMQNVFNYRVGGAGCNGYHGFQIAYTLDCD